MVSKIHEPGVYVGLPMEDYLRDGSLSASGCKEVNEDIGRYWHNSGNNPLPEESEEDSQARKFGTAYHMMIFEPTKFNHTFKIKQGVKQTRMPDMLGEDEFKTMMRMRTALYAGPRRRALLANGVPEVSFFWRDQKTNVPCRIRVDCFSPICWTDLKALKDVRTSALRTAIPSYGFDVTAAMYSEGARALKAMIEGGYKMPEQFSPAFVKQFMAEKTQQFAFMMQEKTPPFITRTQLATQGITSVGISKVEQAIHKYGCALEHYKEGEQWEVEYAEIENMEIEAVSQSIYYS